MKSEVASSVEHLLPVMGCGFSLLQGSVRQETQRRNRLGASLQETEESTWHEGGPLSPRLLLEEYCVGRVQFL